MNYKEAGIGPLKNSNVFNLNNMSFKCSLVDRNVKVGLVSSQLVSCCVYKICKNLNRTCMDLFDSCSPPPTKEFSVQSKIYRLAKSKI